VHGAVALGAGRQRFWGRFGPFSRRKNCTASAEKVTNGARFHIRVHPSSWVFLARLTSGVPILRESPFSIQASGDSSQGIVISIFSVVGRASVRFAKARASITARAIERAIELQIYFK
jgi:hypothetical protein